jgi:hypothetical protein
MAAEGSDGMNPINFFLAHGVNVFPIRAGTKQPEVPKGTSWKRWQGPRPTGSYGVELGALIVIDGDSSKSTAWIRAKCPSTPFRVLTGPHHDPTDTGRGVHFYYRAPAGITPPFIHRDRLVIEGRRLGQYVVGPGSLHPTGCAYTASEWSWDWNDLPVFPADFLFNDGTGSNTPPGAPYQLPERLVAGERSHGLFCLLRHMKANGSTMEMGRSAVELCNANRCEPPKRFKDFEGWFRRAWHLADRPDFGKWEIVDRREVAFVEFPL